MILMQLDQIGLNIQKIGQKLILGEEADIGDNETDSSEMEIFSRAKVNLTSLILLICSFLGFISPYIAQVAVPFFNEGIFFSALLVGAPSMVYITIFLFLKSKKSLLWITGPIAIFSISSCTITLILGIKTNTQIDLIPALATVSLSFILGVLAANLTFLKRMARIKILIPIFLIGVILRYILILLKFEITGYWIELLIPFAFTILFYIVFEACISIDDLYGKKVAKWKKWEILTNLFYNSIVITFLLIGSTKKRID